MNKQQEKIWNILPKFDDELIKEYPDYSFLVKQLLWNRGIKKFQDAEDFLFADFSKTHDPFLFNNMSQAIDLIVKHVKAQNLIYVYGDYDADGVTSSALLAETLKTLRAKTEVYIPHRVSEGYGLNRQAIEFICEQGAKLIITVDGGIRSKDEVAFAIEKGLEVIITDHHVPPEDEKDYPNCLIVDPIVKTEIYPDKNLAGVGVAFKLAQALISRSKLSEEDKQKLVMSLLDFVAIGTVADCVKLRGENRILVREGLRALDKTKRLGLTELIKVSKINNKKLDTWNIGFQIGPRLNAAGRIDHANSAYELLVVKEQKEAAKLARDLNVRNSERQNITEEICAEVEKQIDPEKDWLMVAVFNSGLDAEKKDIAWNEGVVGLVSGRITNKHYRPSLVITENENIYKGSGRSIPEFSIIEAVEQCNEYLLKYGGHPAACGFSLEKNQLAGFLKKIRSIAEQKLSQIDLRSRIGIETELRFRDINESLLDEVNLFAPYGQENDQPKFFSSKIQVMDITYLGADAQHIKLRIKQEDSSVFSALAFNQALRWADVKIGDVIDMAYTLDLNEFNGRKEVQMKIVDIKQ